MSENLRTYTKALYTLDAVARRVPAEAWDAPSCCEGWTAREVAGHAAWVVANVGAAAGANPAPAPQAEADVAGDDPAAIIAAAVQTTLAGLDQQGILQRVVPTPFGEMAIDDFIGALWVDPLTHAFDIADATGIDHGIDAATADAAHASLGRSRPPSGGRVASPTPSRSTPMIRSPGSSPLRAVARSTPEGRVRARGATAAATAPCAVRHFSARDRGPGGASSWRRGCRSPIR